GLHVLRVGDGRAGRITLGLLLRRAAESRGAPAAERVRRVFVRDRPVRDGDTGQAAGPERGPRVRRGFRKTTKPSVERDCSRKSEHGQGLSGHAVYEQLAGFGLAEQASGAEEHADTTVKSPAGRTRVDETRVDVVFAKSAEIVSRELSVSVATGHDPRHHGEIERALKAERHHPEIMDPETCAQVLLEEIG